MDQQLASYALSHLSEGILRKYPSFSDMVLLSAYVLYKKLTSWKVRYDQFWLLVARELLVGLVMPEYAR
jgi:hypothetical protein